MYYFPLSKQLIIILFYVKRHTDREFESTHHKQFMLLLLLFNFTPSLIYKSYPRAWIIVSLEGGVHLWCARWTDFCSSRGHADIQRR